MAEIKDGFDDLLRKMGEKADEARKIAEHVIDTETQTFINAVKPKIPVTDRNIRDRGGMQRAFTVEKIPDRNGWYGYKISFEGETSKGDSWEKIANVVNYGTANRAGTGFIDKPKKALKGMSARIEARIRAEFDDLTK